MRRMLDKTKRTESSASASTSGAVGRTPVRRPNASSGRIGGGDRLGANLVGRHAGKSASKFQFDIIVESVSGITVPGSYAIKWSRGVKVASTKPKSYAPTAARGAAPTMQVSQKLTLLCTLYRASATSPFDDKDAKLSLISYAGRGEKAMAKVHFNLSEFAGVPSATAKKTFPLANSKFTVTVTIIASFMGSGGRGAGSITGSSLSGLSMGSSADDGASTADDLSDLSDEMASIGTSKRETPAIEKPPASAPAARKAPTTAVSAIPSVTETASEAEIEKLRAENSRLKQKAADADKLKKENTALQTKVAETNAIVQQYQKRALDAEKEASELKAEQQAAPLARVDSDSKKVVRLTLELENMRTQLENVTKEREDVKKERDLALQSDSNALVNSMQKSQQDLMKENEAIRKQNEELLEQLDEMEIEKEQLQLQATRSSSRGATGAVDDAKLVKMELESAKKKLIAKDAEISMLNRRLEDTAAKAKQNAAAESSDQLNKRISKLESESAAAQSKIKSHESHTKKMKGTYQELSDMYSKIRQDYIVMQGKYKKKSAQLAEIQSGASTVSSVSAQNSEELLEAISRETKAKEELEVATSKVVELEGSILEQSQKISDMKSEIAKLQSRDTQSGTVNADLKKELDRGQKELKECLDLVERLRDEADASFQEFNEAKRELESRCEELRDERDSTEAEVNRLRKRRGIETDNLKRDLDRSAEEIEKLRKKKNEELEVLMNERDNALQQIDRLRREHERRLKDLEDELDSTASSHEFEQKVKTLEIQLTAARSREQNLDEELTKLRTAYDRKSEQLKSREEELRAEQNKAASLTAAAASAPKPSGPAGSSIDEEVVHQLIETKIKLADAEEEILKYKNIIRKFKDGRQKQVLERIAEHASNLEVKLNETRNELARYRAADPNRTSSAPHGS